MVLKKKYNILLIIFLVILLILVRVFESLFYDPLTHYFESDYLHQSLPEMNQSKLMLNVILRFFINSFISVLIIKFLFNNKSFVKFSIWFYLVMLFILMLFFIIFTNIQLTDSYLPLFYVRRFLIHPIFIFLLIPAFYYQDRIVKK